MPNNEKPKKPNDSNGLERCPMGTDIGVFGKAERSIDNFTAGFIYATAITELVKEQNEIDIALETLDEDEEVIRAEIRRSQEELDVKWALVSAMYGFEA